MMNIPVNSDTISKKYEKPDKHEETVIVQNVLGTFDPVLKETFTDVASDEESDTYYNTDSISYVARDVEYLDSLNFDDSDTSIDKD